MIYLKSSEKRILVVEPANLIDLKAGEVIFSPDREVLIVYTPDLLWFQRELQKDVRLDDKSFSVENFDRIHKTSMKLKERIERPYHETKLW